VSSRALSHSLLVLHRHHHDDDDLSIKSTYLLQMSIGCAEEGDCVLFRAGNGDGSQQSVAVCQRWRAVDWHDAGDFQSDLAEIVDVARRLKSKKNKRKTMWAF
jgi:hypothetical protein